MKFRFVCQVFYGIGFYGGTGPPVNDSYDNAGYGTGGISWLTQTSFNQTNLLEDNPPFNSYRGMKNIKIRRRIWFSI